MADLQLTSPTNPRLKAVVHLRNRRARERSGTVVVDGYDELDLAVTSGIAPMTLFYCPDLMVDPPRQLDLVQRCRSLGSATFSVARPAFERVAYRQGPDGFLAVLPAPGIAVADLEVPEDALVLICEAVEKPGNLGAILRTADAAGVAAVIAADPVSDWGNPNVIRSSKGCVFSLPLATGTRAEVLAWVAGRGMRLVATTPVTEVRHTEVDYTGNVAIAVGTERDGLTRPFLDHAAVAVRIPMAGVVNSLNVATSAAIVTYEAVRQRTITC
ncbi:MAG: TrmH family RNA methyltransferase [Nostocoides sp.]